MVGDNGFKDTVIWYSIVDYVKNNVTVKDSHIILLTNNDKDFNSAELLEEFNEITGRNIKIYNADQEEFLSFILSKYRATEIDNILVSHIEINGNVNINSINILPLNCNMPSPLPQYIDPSKFKEISKKSITTELEKLGFNVEKLKFKYIVPKPKYVKVELRNYEFLYLDNLDIELNYDDGSTVYAECPENINFSIELGENEDYEKTFKTKISSYLEEQGYGPIDPSIIYYEIVDFIPPAGYRILGG